MSDHLPECPYVVFDQQGLIPATVIPGGCICSALRACEQRVENRFHFYTGPEVYAKGYDDALRDVVRAISTKPKQIGGYAEPWIKLPDAIAAIDALREGTK